MRMTPADSLSRHLTPGRLMGSASFLATVGLLTAACSTPGVSTPDVSTAGVSSPARSLPSTAAASAPATSPGTQQVIFASSLAPFTLPQALSRPTVFAAGQTLLVVGGLTGADTTTQDILRIAIPGGTVTPAGQLPVPVHDAAGAVVSGRDLVLGGGSTTVTSAVQDVTPGSPSRVVSHLPQPRADLVAVSDGTSGYVLGGYDGKQGSTSVLRTRDGKTFTVAGTLPISVRYPAVALSAGSIWLFGGEHDGKQVTDVQRIDLATGHGRVAGHLPTPLAHAGAFTLEGAVLIAGGRIGDTATDIVLRFNPAAMRFAAAGHLPAARSDFGVALVGNTAYLVGGEGPKAVDTVIQVRAQAGGTP